MKVMRMQMDNMLTVLDDIGEVGGVGRTIERERNG